MSLHDEAMSVLQETSRTFFIPISRLPGGLREAVASAYLCMRAIDEIEDHPTLENVYKAKLLRRISLKLQTIAEDGLEGDLALVFNGYDDLLPEVTVRILDWTRLAPKAIAPRIFDAIAAMADRMAHWADVDWEIRTQEDLDCYTFGVAGAVGLLLSDLWNWYDGTQTDRGYAIGFGRGLQSVNILRNRTDDLGRGVDFFPLEWDVERMFAYARHNLSLADAYTAQLQPGPALDFCSIPLALAYATLEALASGRAKLTRSEVLQLTGQFSKYPQQSVTSS